MSMVVHNGDLRRTIGGPLEDNSPLVIDSNRVPTSASPAEWLEAVARWDRHVFNLLGGIKSSELVRGNSGYLREAAILLRAEKFFGIAIRKGENHWQLSFPTHQ